MGAIPLPTQNKAMGRQPVRLYLKGTFVGYPRGRHDQKPEVALVAIEGVKDKKDTEFYLGKRVAYIYRASRKRGDSNIRVVWGRITRAHGTNGVVRCTFRRNLPPKAMGASVRVMLYPSRV